jgi:hypothetical protein
MGRTFDLPAAGRRYSIRVMSIDEGWELWVYEGRRPLLLGGTVGMDAALEAWRAGNDAVVRMVEHIRADFASGRLSTNGPRGVRAPSGSATRGDPLRSPVP